MFRRLGALAAAVALCALTGASAAGAATRDVLFVGNNWDGTADVIDPATFERIARLDIVPDKQQRLAEIRSDPIAQGYFLAIRQAVGEGHDQFVDDMFSSHDGRHLYVSRPSFADVVAFDLRTGRIVWRVRVDGYRADHMAISPDGGRLLVSASTARVVDVIDPSTGTIVARIPSGDQPHESNFSRDGRLIYHASIGAVYTPFDQPVFDTTKGERIFEIVDAGTYQVLKRIDMGRKLAEFGMPDMSSAVRPMALSPDERFVYFQVSFFHGFVEYDMQQDRVTRVASLPLSETAAKMRREEYVLDSAHHGLSINPEGTKLCAAGTMSDYAAIVSRATFSHRIVPVGPKPYWSTNSGDGRYCFVSVSGEDRVSVISYDSEEEVARIPVGDHPQRMRMGRIEVAGGPASGREGAAGGTRAASRPMLRLLVRVTPRRVRANRPVTLRIRVRAVRGGRHAPVPGVRIRVAGTTLRTDRLGRATLRRRHGFPRARTYTLRAARGGYLSGAASLRVVR